MENKKISKKEINEVTVPIFMRFLNDDRLSSFNCPDEYKPVWTMENEQTGNFSWGLWMSSKLEEKHQNKIKEVYLEYCKKIDEIRKEKGWIN